MKWLNIRGLVICIIVFILLDSVLYNANSYTIQEMNSDFSNSYPFSEAYIAGSTVIAFLTSLLIYLIVFLKKKK